MFNKSYKIQIMFNENQQSLMEQKEYDRHEQYTNVRVD